MKCTEQQVVTNVVEGHTNLFFVKQKYTIVQENLAVQKLIIFCTTADGIKKKVCPPSLPKKKVVREEMLRNTATKNAFI
jgi:hypothetical protein